MTLLDRFRTQPRQKHPDPAVRLAYVDEIPLGEREAILAMAREDDDPRVRKAAVGKLMDPPGLGRIAREDGDEAVRAAAVAMLRDIALEVFEGVAEGGSLDAVDALNDPKPLVQIAKSTTRAVVALKATARITDAHSLGSIARHAVTEDARRGAFELLRERGEHAEIFGVAMNGEYKDTAVAAVDLVSDPAELDQIALRAKNKAAAKRARTIVREKEEQTARAAADAAAASALVTAAAGLHPDAGLIESVSAPAVSSSAADMATDAATDAAVDAATESAQAEAAERVRVEQEVARVREETDAVERARVQAEAAEAARRDAERRHARLTEIAGEASVAAADADLAAARKRLGAARREWRELAAGVEIDPAVAGRFAEADAQMMKRDAEAREADARARREALARVIHLLARVEPLALHADATLKATDRALRDVRTALGNVPQLPSKADADDVVRRLKAAQVALTQKVHELRESADWQRWANAGVQEELCVKMEALRAAEDPEAAAHGIRDLQRRWREAADVPRAQADALWRRFKSAHDEVWAKCEAHFAAQAEVREQNLAKKISLSEKAEALAESTSWIQTADEIKRLQVEWKTIGPVSRGREKAIWDRFRAACDRFFTRRHDDLAQRKSVWAENFAKKEALAVKAEGLADSSDWEGAAAQIRQLQVEWKAIGPVKKSRSEAIWQRFRASCDKFFTRYAQRHNVARAERVVAREAICAELEAYAQIAPVGDDPQASSPGQQPPENLLVNVRTLRGRWQQELAARGVEPTRARALDDRFTAAFAGVLARWPAAFGGTDLDPDANRKRMESLVGRLEQLASSLEGPALSAAGDAALSPTTRLAALLKEALAANTIGGKVDDDSRWRAAAEDVRQAQASWARIGPVPEATRRSLADRFQRACRRITERAAKAGAAGSTRPARLT